MRKQFGLIFVAVLLFVSSTYSIFASEKLTLKGEEKEVLQTAILEDEAERQSEEAKNISEEVVKTERAVAKESKSKSTARAILQNGTIGTVDWTLDDAGVLTFGGGVFPDTYSWYTLGNFARDRTVTVNFTAPITAGISLRNMFQNYDKLTAINGFENLDTANTGNFNSMFYGCSKLTELDLSNFNTSNGINMGYMFYECNSLTSLDLSNFDTSNTTYMACMFAYCSSLTSLDVSNFNTSNITSTSYLFYGCSSLTSLDVSSFNTSNVTDTRAMFQDCSSLETLALNNFNTSNVTRMNSMFQGCSGLKNLDISSFDTSKVAYMGSIFQGCSSLSTLDVSNFDTNNLINITNMFYDCSSLTSLDVSAFNTSKMTGFQGVFYGCRSLTSLDLSTFTTLNKNITDMFTFAPIQEIKLGNGFGLSQGGSQLGSPLNNSQYTGNWKLVETGEILTHNELLAYDGTKPGTYIWEKIEAVVEPEINEKAEKIEKVAEVNTKAGKVEKVAKANTKAPKTGDEAKLLGALVILMASAGYVVTRRKRIK